MHSREIIIDANRSNKNYWSDTWQYRELLYFLAWRDLLVRYKQTLIGVAWSILRPLLTMAVFTFVFGRLARLPSGDTPYPLLVMCGLVPWLFFSSALSDSSNSLISNANLISKVFFPRIIVPISSVVVSFADFLIALGLLFGLALVIGNGLSWQVFAIPLFAGMTFIAALGIGLWFASLNVKYRDFRFVIPFLMQLGLYASPVGYSVELVPEKWRVLYSLNPMVGIIDGFRWSILGTGEPNWTAIGMSAVIIAGIFTGGLWFFRKTERTFADVI